MNRIFTYCNEAQETLLLNKIAAEYAWEAILAADTRHYTPDMLKHHEEHRAILYHALIRAAKDYYDNYARLGREAA